MVLKNIHVWFFENHTCVVKKPYIEVLVYGLCTASTLIPGIKVKVEVSKIVTTTGIKNSRNGLGNIKTQGFPFTGIKFVVVRISEIVTTTGNKNST